DIHIPIFGNGDIDSPQKALEYKNRYGVDGIMIGRAAIGYPWIFNEVKHYFKSGLLLPKPTIVQRIETVKKHLEFAVKWKGEKIGVFEMRSHYTNYFRGIDGIKPYRQKLVEANSYLETLEVLEEIAGAELVI
ncbi:MAG TPA: tRNA-dihydrouridine synthase, partial [Cytophagales bacterium]|nr:tRNA-dihydrouridine synthase [Cytophagales bacterium]